jgi:hypothetical protein
MEAASCASLDVWVPVVDSSVPTRPASLPRSVTSAVTASDVTLSAALVAYPAATWSCVA